MGGDPDAGGAQSQGNIIRQIGDLGELHTLLQYKLVPGDGGTMDHIAGSCVHTEAVERLCQTAGVVPQFRTSLDVVFSPAFMQQRNGRELIVPLPPESFS